VPFEESQQQFIPLQAVKQQRNKVLGALPQQQVSREWPQQQLPVEQNQPLPVEPTVTIKVTTHRVLIITYTAVGSDSHLGGTWLKLWIGTDSSD
jgi:hypothetical protein